MSNEVIVDCDKCSYAYACCTKVRAPLTDADLARYEFNVDPGLARRGINTIRRTNGCCYYFNPDTKKCKIWDDRPEICRKFDCSTDKKIKYIAEQEAKKVKKKIISSGKVRAIISIAIVDADDKTKTTPMIVNTNNKISACEVFEVIESPEKVLDTACNFIKQKCGSSLRKFKDEYSRCKTNTD